jgi:hypothetical protein
VRRVSLHCYKVSRCYLPSRIEIAKTYMYSMFF